MELEDAVLEAIKVKLQETFKKITVTVDLEGRDVVLRFTIPDDIMHPPVYVPNPNINGRVKTAQDLDYEATLAMQELTGDVPQEQE